MSQVEEIHIGKYSFKITETKFQYGDRIISHTFKIGGNYDNCISISYTYQDNKPISAKIPHAQYEPECSIGSTLEKGEGTTLMLKTLLRYAHNKIKQVTIFHFDDMSHIDCVDKVMSKSIPRTPTMPLNLSYFSLAYNSETWYERHFNAKMSDKEKYAKYKEKRKFLTDPEQKPPFVEFLEIAQPPEDQYEYLETLYNKSATYRVFFDSIPRATRCKVLYPWLTTFMEYYLKDVFSNYGWEIDVTEMNTKGGRRTRRRARSNHRIVYHKRMDMV
jgi:hypothetical protein